MTSPRDMTFQVGELLNNTFRIEAALGSGGTSEVFRARNEISGRLVALKVLKAEFAGNEDFLVLMKREEEMRDIRHDAVVGYSENHRTADGHIYLVMDFVDGPSLEEKMKAGGMPPEELLVVAKRVSQGLHAAHERRIVHRDLSPDNIILKGGEPARAVIIDFGIAKDANPGAKTVVGSEFAGKFTYAAPEQFGGTADARTDIFSLGMTLLATFRGKAPKLGGNLIEVLEAKKAPVDLSDVPEPLRGLLSRMLDPDPERRYQSCQQILNDLTRIEADEPLSGAAADPLDILAPAPPSAPEPKPAPETPAAKPAPKAKQKRSPVLPILLVLVVLAAGGAAAWFMGLFAPGLPLADPFILRAERGDIGGPVLAGNVPSEEMQLRLTALATENGGSENLTLARGDLAEGWEAGVEDALSRAEALDVYSLMVEGNRIELNGRTATAEVRDMLEGFFQNAALPEGMTIEGAIDFVPPPLPVENLMPILEQFANCGPLTLVDPPAGGYLAEDTIAVTGKLLSAEVRLELFEALSSASENRDVKIETEILSPALCVSANGLPKLPAGGVAIDFAFGGSGQPNPSGEYFVGENPVIDVVIPANAEDGFLYVSIVDVTGSVFHLLPNMNRKTNDIATLREGQTGDVSVRVAFPASEAAPERIAFLVDDSLLGESKVLVLQSETPLFDTLRPTAESVESYTEALEAAGPAIRSMDSRILTLSAK